MKNLLLIILLFTLLSFIFSFQYSTTLLKFPSNLVTKTSPSILSIKSSSFYHIKPSFVLFNSIDAPVIEELTEKTNEISIETLQSSDIIIESSTNILENDSNNIDNKENENSSSKKWTFRNLNEQIIVPVLTPSQNNTLYKSPYSLYLGNLSFDLDEGGLQQLIDDELQYKISNKFVLIKDKITKKSRGFGYINFKSQEDLNEGLNLLKDFKIEDRVVKIDETIQNVSTSYTPSNSTNKNYPTIFIGNLNFNVDHITIRKAFKEAYGEDVIRKIRIVVDKTTGQSRGFAHAEIRSEADLDPLLDKLNGLEIEGRKVRVDRALDKSSRSDNINNSSFSMYLGNLSWDVDEELLKEMLTSILVCDESSLKSIKLGRDPITGNSRGFAHIEFFNEELLTKALDELQGLELLGRIVKVDRGKKLKKNNNKKFFFNNNNEDENNNNIDTYNDENLNNIDNDNTNNDTNNDTNYNTNNEVNDDNNENINNNIEDLQISA